VAVAAIRPASKRAETRFKYIFLIIHPPCRLSFLMLHDSYILADQSVWLYMNIWLYYYIFCHFLLLCDKKGQILVTAMQIQTAALNAFFFLI
jgi:hypothetical protein